MSQLGLRGSVRVGRLKSFIFHIGGELSENKIFISGQNVKNKLEENGGKDEKHLTDLYQRGNKGLTQTWLGRRGRQVKLNPVAGYVGLE